MNGGKRPGINLISHMSRERFRLDLANRVVFERKVNKCTEILY